MYVRTERRSRTKGGVTFRMAVSVKSSTIIVGSPRCTSLGGPASVHIFSKKTATSLCRSLRNATRFDNTLYKIDKMGRAFQDRSTSKISDRLAIISFSLEDSFPAISSSPTYRDVAKPRETTSDDVTNDVTDLC